MSVSTPVDACWLVLGPIKSSEPIASSYGTAPPALMEEFEWELGTSSTIHPT
jgi:hypothetical protein